MKPNINLLVGGVFLQKFKCQVCKLILKEEDLEEGNCPECKNKPHKMCGRDNCTCHHEITESIAYCPDCKQPMCPICESHDVSQISRVTGYLQEVGGWNKAKQRELMDRVHYDVA